MFELRALVDGHLLRLAHERDIDWELIHRTFRNANFEYALNAFLVNLHGVLGDTIPPPCRIGISDRLRWMRVRSRLQNPSVWKALHYLQRASRLPRRLTQPDWYRRKWRFVKLPRSERERVLYGGEIRPYHPLSRASRKR